ncbi:MAG: hypothetical protein ACRDT8_26915 [Micromonosporaceae bacterium]
MTENPPGASDPSNPRPARRKSRRDRIRDEIDANRRGDYTVPTWVLFLALLALIAGLALVVILSR